MKISNKKKKYIKKNYPKMSEFELANELKLSDKDVKRVIEELGLAPAKTIGPNNKINIFQKYEHLFILVAVLLALIIRTFLTSLNLKYPDSTCYLALAREITKGNFHIDYWVRGSFYIEPFYSFLIAIFSVIFRNFEFSGALVSILSGSFLIIPIFYISNKFYGKKVAWISTAILIFYPSLINFSTGILTESLFIFLYITTVAMGVYAIYKNQTVYYFILGIIIGLSYLTRIVGFPSLALVIVWIIIFRAFLFRVKLKRIVSHVIIIIAGFSIVSGPYLFYLHSELGKWVISGREKEIKFAVEKKEFNNQFAKEKEFDTLTVDGKDFLDNIKKDENDAGDVFTIIKKSYKGYVSRVLGVFYEYQKAFLSSLSFIVVIFVIAGFILRRYWNLEDIINELYLVSWIFSLAIIYAFARPYIHLRYTTPLIPIIIIWLGKGIIETQERIINPLLGGRGGSETFIFLKKLFPALIIIIIFIIFIPQLRELRSSLVDTSPWNAGHKDVGYWLKEKLPPGSKIMDRNPFIAYYAAGKYVIIPFEPYERIINFARYNGIACLVIDSSVIQTLRPQLNFLISSREIPSDLKLIYRKFFPEYKKIISVYQIL